MIARELVETVKKNVAIDWTVRENVRANLRVLVKRILRKYGYPPDKQEQATRTVLEQAAVLSEAWAVVETTSTARVSAPHCPAAPGRSLRRVCTVRSTQGRCRSVQRSSNCGG